MNIRVCLIAFLYSISVAAVRGADDRQFYEWRIYTTKSEQQQKLVNDYWQNAAVPAYNRMGVKSVGVFTELQDSPTNRIFVLLPFDSFALIAQAPEKLAADSDYQKAAESFMAVPKNDPAYVRYESSILVAFKGMKKLELPPSSAEKKPWIFELRTYQSHNEAKGDNKVEMFNAGEIQVMKEIGLHPVFFAQALTGTHLPNLTYMVSGENQEEYKKPWRSFGAHPTWKKLLADPQYKDNVSKIVSVFLKRTPASQI